MGFENNQLRNTEEWRLRPKEALSYADSKGMAATDRPISAGVSLDALAVHAFVREMTDILEFVAHSSVLDADRKVLWSQAFQNTNLSAADYVQALDKLPKDPTKHTIGSQGTAFFYPSPAKTFEVSHSAC